MSLVVIHQLASHSAICTEHVVCEMGYFSVIRLLCSCPILCPDTHPPVYGTTCPPPAVIVYYDTSANFIRIVFCLIKMSVYNSKR